MQKRKKTVGDLLFLKASAKNGNKKKNICLNLVKIYLHQGSAFLRETIVWFLTTYLNNLWVLFQTEMMRVHWLNLATDWSEEACGPCLMGVLADNPKSLHNVREQQKLFRQMECVTLQSTGNGPSKKTLYVNVKLFHLKPDLYDPRFG